MVSDLFQNPTFIKLYPYNKFRTNKNFLIYFSNYFFRTGFIVEQPELPLLTVPLLVCLCRW